MSTPAGRGELQQPGEEPATVYGTIATLRCKPGGEEWVRAWMDVQSQRPMEGWVSTTVYRSDDDPQLLRIAVVFESRDAYHANAATPLQDRLYHQMLSGLEEPPVWHDGEIISHKAAASASPGG